MDIVVDPHLKAALYLRKLKILRPRRGGCKMKSSRISLLGTVVLILSCIYTFIQIIGWPNQLQNITITYLSLAFIPLAFHLLLINYLYFKTLERRDVENAEIQSLFSEVNRWKSLTPKSCK